MEIFLLVLSLVTYDGEQTDYAIRGFYQAEECDAFKPAYKQLIGKFDSPEDVKYAQVICVPFKLPGDK